MFFASDKNNEEKKLLEDSLNEETEYETKLKD